MVQTVALLFEKQKPRQLDLRSRRSINTHRPEIAILRTVELVKAHSGRSGTELKIEGGALTVFCSSPAARVG